jgi:hypothetical protein
VSRGRGDLKRIARRWRRAGFWRGPQRRHRPGSSDRVHREPCPHGGILGFEELAESHGADGAPRRLRRLGTFGEAVARYLQLPLQLRRTSRESRQSQTRLSSKADQRSAGDHRTGSSLTHPAGDASVRRRRTRSSRAHRGAWKSLEELSLPLGGEVLETHLPVEILGVHPHSRNPSGQSSRRGCPDRPVR